MAIVTQKHVKTPTSLVLVTFCLLQSCDASVKKGVAVSDGDRFHRHCGDERIFTNVHWWYDWHESPWEHSTRKCAHSLRPGYVPMIWGWRQKVDIPIKIPRQAKYVLGFNEPNFDSQSKMSPKEAARHWKRIQRKARGKILVSPAVGQCATCTYKPIEWLDEFFQVCRDCKIEHIATHSYHCNPNDTMSYLEELWYRYKKPIWLTEFACPQDKTAEHQLRYMKEILPRLESAHFIFRYAWFVSRNSENRFTTIAVSLLHQNSGDMTTLGKFYNDFEPDLK